MGAEGRATYRKKGDGAQAGRSGDGGVEVPRDLIGLKLETASPGGGEGTQWPVWRKYYSKSRKKFARRREFEHREAPRDPTRTPCNRSNCKDCEGRPQGPWCDSLRTSTRDGGREAVGVRLRRGPRDDTEMPML